MPPSAGCSATSSRSPASEPVKPANLHCCCAPARWRPASTRSRSARSARASGARTSNKGVTALIIGMAGVFVFMALYYQVFGLVADLVLLANVVLLTALLSMMRASLSLAGHRRHHPHRRHGGGCQRADLRAHPRGDPQGRVAAGGDPLRLREGFLGDRRFQRHDADRRCRALGARHRRRSAASPWC